MPINTPLNQESFDIKKVTTPPKVDLQLPNYDRSEDRGNFLVVSFNRGEVEFSSYCASFSRALAMTRLSKRDPTWVVSGLENELITLKKICGVKADWLTAPMIDSLIKTQLGKTLKIVTTFNL